MSEFQLWMIALGAAVLIGVFAYNKYQEARVRRRAEEAFGPPHDDVLLDAGNSPAVKVAPPIDLDGVDSPRDDESVNAVSGEGANRVEHRLGLPEPAVLPTGTGPLHDPRVDFIAVLVFTEPTPGEAILRHAESLLGEAPKAVAWEGLNAAGDRWMPLSPRDRYGAARPALQLVDRRGRITENDLNAFCAKLQELAVTLVGELHLPSRSETLRAAERLDALCSEVDMQIGLNIVRPEGVRLAGPRIRDLVAANGCVLDEDGRFRKKGTGGSEYYCIANLDPVPFTTANLATMTASGITILLDVPRAPRSEETFVVFRDVAAKLAQALDARILDDNRQPVSTASLQSIATQVSKAQERMRTEGIDPGAALALRLFT